MGFFQNIGRSIGKAFRLKQLDTKDQASGHTHFTGRLRNGYGFMANGPEHKLVKMLSDCWDEKSGKIDPRSWVKLSRIMYNHIGIFENAVNIHASLVGRVKLADDSPISDRTKSLITEFFRNCPNLSEWDDTFSDTLGMDNLIRGVVIDTLVEGTAFSQDRFKVSDGVLSNEHIGVLRFASDNFDYTYHEERLELTYAGTQYPRLDSDGNRFNNPYFHTTKFDTQTGYPWGVPLIRGGSLLAELLVVMLVSIMRQTQRFANPVSFNLIQPKDTLGSNAVKDGTVDAILDLRKLINNAFEGMQEGKPQEVLFSMPHAIDMESKIFGEGFTGFIDDGMLVKIIILFTNVLNIPAPLLGFDLGGQGIGSDKFKHLFHILMGRIGRIQSALKPLVSQILKNYLYSLKVSPSEVEAIVIDFNTSDTLTPKERAEIEKMKSETNKNNLEIYEALAITNEDQALRFAIEVGLFEE